jgi:type VI secretion system protein ImpH
MADDARQSLPDLEGADADRVTDSKVLPAKSLRRMRSPASADNSELSAAYDFFELLRRLEQRGGRFGQSGRPRQEPARLGQFVRLSFATRDVMVFDEATEKTPARVTVANLGLLGPEGPLPLHLTRWVLDRLSQRWFSGADAHQTSDTTFVDFVNVLQHRMIALFYRAWADANPAVQVERSTGGRVREMLEAMAGIGLPGTADAELDAIKLRQAAALASQVDGPERLTLFIAEAFKVPVQLMEFVADWMPIPRHLQSSLGGPNAALGRSATIGPRVFTRQSRVEVRIGPLSYRDYLAFLPGGKRLELVKKAIRDLIGEALDVDFRLVLAQDEVPLPKIGNVQLGRTTWLARPVERGDADEMRMRTIVGWRPDAAGAAA